MTRKLLVSWLAAMAIVLPFSTDLLAQDLGSAHHFTIKDKTSGEPLTGVSILSLGSEFRTISDSLGMVKLPAIIIRRNEKLEISSIGYQTIHLSARRLHSLPWLELETQVSALDAVIVSGNSPSAKVRDIQMGTELITAAEARKLPAILGEVDIIKILQLKPGVKSAGEGLAGFYVRGGGSDQNLILLDNAPVYNPNHLLGLFSVFNNDAVKEVKLYKAAYPAEYSGRLSSVVDVAMRPGSLDSFGIAGGIGALSSRLSVEAPIKKGKSSFILSGRRTYFDVFTRSLNRMKEHDSAWEVIPSYYFSDLNFRADFRINRKNAVWVSGYWGSDHFSSASNQFSARFNWGNRTASLNWRNSLIHGTEMTSSVFYSGYSYQLSNQFNSNNLVLKSNINTIGLNLTLASANEAQVKWQTGLNAMIHRLTIGDFNASSDLSGFVSGEKASGNEFGAFINSEWDNDKQLAILAGIRLSGFTSEGKMHLNLQPRIAARYELPDESSLKASYTRMYQYLHLASLSSASLPTDMWYPSTEKTRPQFADQFSVGWAKAVNNNTLFMSVETYYKWMNNQVEFRDGADVFSNPKLETEFVYGRGYAYGVEAYIEKKKGRTTGWFGYTLSWTKRIFEDINDGFAFSPRHDRRHDFSFVFMHRINRKFTLSGNWIFGSGAFITVPTGRFIFQDQVGDRPTTITPVYTKRSNYQLPPVHRLDLSLVMALKSKRGAQDITFTLYNAYSRRNPFFIQFREADNVKGYVTHIEPTLISLFPILPGITYNFKF